MNVMGAKPHSSILKLELLPQEPALQKKPAAVPHDGTALGEGPNSHHDGTAFGEGDAAIPALSRKELLLNYPGTRADSFLQHRTHP
ncbi:hypothetical protein GH733_005918 [Mirounga leonina]|nr:hypothetical protein GH733_005918 [Mirounga leonina]